MTIWVLALVLFIITGLTGYVQGAIRAGFSLLGLLVSALLAGPCTRLTTPIVKTLLGGFSVQNPVVIWAVAPVAAFVVLMLVFLAMSFAVHRQVEVYYKYKAGELRLALWERLNKRVGICVGLVSGLVYLVLFAWGVSVASYATTQMIQADSGTKLVRLVNHMGKDVSASGLGKAVRAVDPVPVSFYQAADILGLIYHNPVTQSRLSRYPSFLALSERQEFQELAGDKDFLEMLARQAPIGEVLANPKTKAILENSALLRDIWNIVGADLPDLHDYLLTGRSAKYSGEPILGFWEFDPAASYVALKQARPNASALDLQKLRKYLFAAFNKANFVALPDHTFILKDVVMIKPPAVIKADTLNNLEKRQGQWQDTDGKYSVTLPDFKEMTGSIENGKLKLAGEWTPLVFVPEE